MIENYKSVAHAQGLKRPTQLKLLIRQLSVFFIAFASTAAFAQPESLDHSYNAADTGFGNGSGTNAAILKSVVQPDGKMIVSGLFTLYNGANRNRVARLNADGSLDATFNPGSGANSQVTSISLQSDGKIILGGSFTSFNGSVANRIVRLNSDGSIDGSFAVGSGAGSAVRTTLVLSDGKILVGGSFTTFNGMAHNRVIRLNADGSIDNSFSGVGPNGDVNSLAVHTDGKILVGGHFTNYNGSNRNYLTRLNTDGSLDAGFVTGTSLSGAIYAIEVDADDKILAGGDFTSFGATGRNRIIRLQSNGALDASFNPGSGANNIVRAIMRKSDGKITVGGSFTNFAGSGVNYLTQLNADGTRDLGFNTAVGPDSGVYSISLLPTNNLAIAGAFNSFAGMSKSGIIGISANGSVDGNFNPTTGVSDPVDVLIIQGDGKAIIGGNFQSFNNQQRNDLVRVNADGTIDMSFIAGTGSNGSVRALAIQPDAKILVGGSFTQYNGLPRGGVVRLNSDGSVDASFANTVGTADAVNAIAVQPNGKVIVAGSFISFNNTVRNRIVRLNVDGTLDESFAVGAGPNGSIESVIVLVDGKILVGGAFTSFNAIPNGNIVRLNADGSLDNTFSAGTGANGGVNELILQSDGKILIGGSFSFYNGATAMRLARLNADGSRDASFSAVMNNTVHAIAIESDGKIFVGGDFTLVNGVSRNYIARLNPNGTLISPPIATTGANDTVRAIAMQSDGKVLIGGDFTAYNGTGRNHLARINTVLDISLEVTGISAESPLCPEENFNVNYTTDGTFGGSNIFTAELSDAAGSFGTPVVIGTVNSTTSGSIIAAIPEGTPAGSGYRIRVTSSSPVFAGTDNGSDLAVNMLGSYYVDADGDGLGTGDLVQVCVEALEDVPAGYSLTADDCNDDDPDNIVSVFYLDLDGDGYGDPETAIEACIAPENHVLNGDDCDDNIASINPGMVEILYNGVDDNCDGEIDEGNQIVTQISEAQCGSTLPSVSTLIVAQYVPHMTRYRFYVRNTETEEVQILERYQYYFHLTSLDNYDYATTYGISIELQRNGVWLGYTGPECLVSSPAILADGGAAQITLCGSVIPSVNTLIASPSLPGATGYRFRVTNASDPLAPNQVQVLTRPGNWFKISMLETFTYGTSYLVEVAVKTTGDYTEYGSPCEIIAPAVPTIVECGMVIPLASTPVSAPSLQYATSYKFELTNMLTNSVITMIRPTNYFRFNQIPGYSKGTPYSIRVAVMTKGVFSDFGEPCEITSPGAASARFEEQLVEKTEFGAIAYPNPFADSFSIEVTTSMTETINVKMYDMTGRLLESADIAPSEASAIKLGEKYPSGVYNVIVSQGEVVKTLRVIKR